MREVALFEPSGEPTVYIAADEDLTIYSWDGQPLAYLNKEHIYGFNGKHLGWFEEGIVWDHAGCRVGYVRETLPVYAQYESYKSYKSYKPYKSYQEYAPYKPYRSLSESSIPLLAHLRMGAE